MQSIGDVLKFDKPKIHISSKKFIICMIADKVKICKDPLKNWRAIAKQLKPLSAEEATRLYELCKCGTSTNSSDFVGEYLKAIKDIPIVKKPKQKKLL